MKTLHRFISRNLLRIMGLLLILVTITGILAQQYITQNSGVPIPGNGHAYYGVQLDWKNDSVNGYAARLGHTPAVYGDYENYPLTATSEHTIDGEVKLLVPHKSILMLTLEPWGGLSSVNSANLAQLTSDLKSWNNQGVPVLVRFAQEMDGGWYPWGQQPALYVHTFQEVANAVHKAPTSSTLWSPNEGGGYPFTGGEWTAKPGTADFKALDTNHDGEVTMADDPYAPFYPGDKYVDWVGLSVYHFGKVWPWGANNVPDSGKFIAKITGTYKSKYVDETALPNFYTEFAVGHNKPFAISETSALYTPSNKEGASDIQIKSAWMQQVFTPDLLKKYPQIKLIAWFEHEKTERDTETSPVDWRVTSDPTILAEFKRILPSWLQYGR